MKAPILKGKKLENRRAYPLGGMVSDSLIVEYILEVGS